jgi:hypothetical protein
MNEVSERINLLDSHVQYLSSNLSCDDDKSLAWH